MNDKETHAKIAGGTAGTATAGGIAATAYGASAATMTATLSTVGSVVGGGMAAGIGITAAAPLLVGAGVYGLWKWVTD